jgi:xylulokinase
MPHLLGIDIGTSGTKSLLLAEDGIVLATHTVSHTLQTPRPGWTEQHPEEWWAATQKSVKGCLKKAGVKGKDVGGVGLSGQMHGSVFLDKHHQVIRPALLWNDQRTAKQCDAITDAAGGTHKLIQLVANPALTGYTAPKILWLRDEEPKNFKKLTHVLLPKDYVRLQMTGDLATDAGDASGTLLVDVKNRHWSAKLLNLLDLDESMLPTIHESPDVTGTLHKAGAKALGLVEGTPVVAGAGDVMSGAIGNGIVEAGLINANLGTGGVMCAHSDEYVVDLDRKTPGRLATMCHAVPGAHVVFGCMLSAAGSFQWYADELARRGESPFGELIELAESAPLGSEGLFFMPHLTGERCPYNDPDARAAWIGLTRRSTEAMMVRSLIEGVTYNMAAMLDIMRGPLGVPVRQVRGTGGGTKSALWRQIQADCYNAPLALTNSEEGGAFGVALLAGVGIGSYKNVPAACKKLIKPSEITRPKKKQATQYAQHRAIYDKLYADLEARFAEIAAL